MQRFFCSSLFNIKVVINVFWISNLQGLSQPRKQLRSLADHIPHGYKKTTLFEVLIRNNVPILRATWFIKVTYLNQVCLHWLLSLLLG